MTELIITLYYYFTSDPLRILSLFGGTGGVIYWYDRFRNRPRFKIISLKQNFGAETPYIEFEIENQSDGPTSLDKYITMRAYSLKKKINYSFAIDIQDRYLPPLIPKKITAIPTIIPVDLYIAWYKRYLFSSTRTGKKRIFFRLTDKEQLSFLRYDLELFLYRWFNFIYKKTIKR